VAASRGIGRVHGGELDGEVTDREVVGAGPTHVGVQCRHGVDPGVSEGYRLGLCSMGSRERSAGTVHAHWGLAVVAVSKGMGRRGVWQGVGLGLLLLLESNWIRQGNKSLPRFARAA
jgi:hypothetical protein